MEQIGGIVTLSEAKNQLGCLPVCEHAFSLCASLWAWRLILRIVQNDKGNRARFGVTTPNDA
jgi:hypothetical protein